MLQVGFYDKVGDVMVEVERFPKGLDVARTTSLQLTMLWASGKHRLPSPYWVAWDNSKHVLSVFALDGDVPDEALCERIRELVAPL